MIHLDMLVSSSFNKKKRRNYWNEIIEKETE